MSYGCINKTLDKWIYLFRPAGCSGAQSKDNALFFKLSQSSMLCRSFILFLQVSGRSEDKQKNICIHFPTLKGNH